MKIYFTCAFLVAALTTGSLYACPNLEGSFDCKGQLFRTVTTATSISIHQTSKDTFTFGAELSGIHEDNQGTIILGAYSQNYSLKLGSQDEPIDLPGDGTPSILRSTVACENGHLTRVVVIIDLRPILILKESFSLNENGDLAYVTNDGNEYSAVCVRK